MRHTKVLILAGFLGSTLVAQPIPGRYVVELMEEPAAALQASLLRRAPGRRPAEVSGMPEVTARREAIRASQQVMARAITARGGRVLGETDTALNALFVQMDDGAAAALRRLPGVRSVTQERRYHATLNRVLPLSKVPEAWAKLGGAAKAGLGHGVAILDSGIDSSHAGFKDDSLTPPSGYPKASSPENEKYLTKKVVVVRSYEALASGEGYGTDAIDKNGHGTNAACAAACVIHAVNDAGTEIAGAAPKAFLGAYKVLGNDGSGATSMILKGIDDAMKDGFDVLNLSLGSDMPADPAGDPEVKALNAAVEAGHIIVVAAGNAGPDENTMNSPGTAEKVITVGSSSSDREVTADGPKPIDPNRISDFSSRGPNPGLGLKPDMLAVGDNFFTASSSAKGEDAYTITQGTSFATPTVAGAAATLKAARPGLTAAQYQSLLINSSSEIKLQSGKPAPIRHQGAGRLDLLAALEMPLTFSPTSVKFGVGGASNDFSREITVTNLLDEAYTVDLSLRRFDERAGPELQVPEKLTLSPKGTATIKITLAGTGLNGEYHGVIVAKNALNGLESRIPYWYGVRSAASKITLLEFKAAGTADEATTFGARVIDDQGIDVEGAELSITTETPGAKVNSVARVDGSPGVFGVELVLAKGDNVFTVTSGAAKRVLEMTGN